MINQLNRGDGQPTPYFFRGPTGGNPAGVNHYVSQHLMLDFHYPCSPVCRGLPVAPWFNPAAAVAPMIELDLARQLMQDQAEFAAEPHPQLNPLERIQWKHFYEQITTYNAEEPESVTVRQDLRRLHALAIARHNYWATRQWIAPAPPRRNRGMPPS